MQKKSSRFKKGDMNNKNFKKIKPDSKLLEPGFLSTTLFALKLDHLFCQQSRLNISRISSQMISSFDHQHLHRLCEWQITILRLCSKPREVDSAR